MIAEGPRREYRGLDVSQDEATVLEIDDWLAEGFAVFGVFHGQAQGALHHRDSANTDLRALVRQLAHQGVETTAFDFAKQAVSRHFDVVKEHLRGVLGVHSDFAQ
ncbi:hypothetical protein D3C84_1047580 [compost metagenome]